MFFHGSTHRIDKFIDDFVGGKEAHDQQGPGIYFTSSWNNARSYGSYVYTVKLNPRKAVSTQDGKKASVKQIEWLIKQAPEWESLVQNWNENPAIGLKAAIKDVLQYNDNPHQQFLQVWIEFYKYNPAEYVRNMVKLGYDIIYITGLESMIVGENNITHAIVLNPAIIEFIEMEDDRTEEEKDIKENINTPEQNIKKYDVVGTINTEKNGFIGVGIVEKIENNNVYISTIASWIQDLNNNSSHQRKNIIKLEMDNVIKINSDNIKNFSIDSQKKYETYIHLLKQYLSEQKIRRFVRNTLKEDVIQEFIQQDEVSLYRYLLSTEEEKKGYLPHEFYYFFDDFLIERGIEFNKPKHMVPSNYADEPEVEEYMFDSDIELITWLENNNKQLYDEFSDYLYEKIKDHNLPINDSEFPTWSYFERPSLVKNQWLIHFTEDANSIAREGFKYGIDDMTKLGLTTHMGEFEKKYGGYNFAYLLQDFEKYGHTGSRYKYGNEAVVFRASGIKMWHYGDNEFQVIFYGNTANNIIPITKGINNEWAIRNIKTGKIIFENDELPKVVDWITMHYVQYSKKLHY